MTIIQNENDKHQSNLIFNSTNDGMNVIDRDKKFILLNKSAEKMIGIHKSEE